MQDREKRDQADLLQAAVSDPIILFTNPEAFKKYAEERERLRKEEDSDVVDDRSHFQRVHDKEMDKRRENPPLVKDEYIANFLASQNAKRGPTIGVDTEEGTRIQPKEELERNAPLRRTGAKKEEPKVPEENKQWQ